MPSEIFFSYYNTNDEINEAAEAIKHDDEVLSIKSNPESPPNWKEAQSHLIWP